MIIDPDKLAISPDPTLLRKTCFKVLDHGQDQPELQIRATAISLLAMCEACKVNVRSLLETNERLMRDIDGPYAHTINAIKEYAKNEITG